MKTKNAFKIVLSICLLLIASLACKAVNGGAPDSSAPNLVPTATEAVQARTNEAATTADATEPVSVQATPEAADQQGQIVSTLTEAANLPEAEPAHEVVRQWAVAARASSTYSDSDWSASQATGQPDTPECDDLPTAWASAERTGLDWLELQYQIPVNPEQINVIETYMPNQVTKVELIDTSYRYHTVYTGQPRVLDCPYTLSVDVNGANYKAIGIKLTIDQTILDPTSWNEIDAVELVGRGTDGEAGGGDIEQPTATAAALDTGQKAGDYTLPDMEPASLNAGAFYFTIAGAGEDATIDKGTLQDQSTSEEYVVGFVSQDFRDAVSLFLPHGMNTGHLPLKPYDGSSFTKGPSAAIYIGSGYYFADGGLVNIESVSSESVTGSFAFEATYESDPTRKVLVSGIFNEIPLVNK